MENETIIQEIIKADLQVLYNLIEPIKDETAALNLAYKTLKYGVNIPYHIEWNLKGMHEIRDRQGIIVLKGHQYNIEQWWDEEETRRSIARKALLEYYEDEKPYEVR